MGSEKHMVFATWALAGISAVTLLAFVISVWLVRNQLELNTQANENLRFIAESDWTVELDKVFMDHPELRPYFDEGRDLTDADSDQQRRLIISAAEVYMDTMDSMLNMNKDSWPDRGWRSWAYDVFSHSPAFRHHLEERRRWYCRHLYPAYLVWAKDAHVSAPAQATCN